MTTKLKEQQHLKGIPVSQGIAIGEAFYIEMPEEPIPEFSISVHAIDEEINRYHAAIQEGKSEILRLQAELGDVDSTEGIAILETHLHMMEDPWMVAEVEKGIRQLKKNAEHVFHTVMKRFQKKFNALKDPFFLDRLKDIRDVSRRILSCLQREHRSNLSEIPPGAILFIRDLSPGDVVEASAKAVAAFVTQGGGIASHAAIVSKAKGIPLLTSVDFNQIELPFEGMVIVDGSTGDLFINPDPETLVEYQSRFDAIQESRRAIAAVIPLPAETYDGYNVCLSANISMIDEVSMLHRHADCSVGLFRSEYMFLSNEEFPSEEKQFEAYRQVVNGMKGRPIVIRVFDLGGDKYMLGQKVPFESNPFLGCRAIRFLLRERQFFKAQLKAILRATVYGNVGIMFPMISSLSELLEVKDLLREAQLELHLFDQIEVRQPRLGCMIEVPSAALIADLLAKECDFLSIGTNDLVQYCLAADRDNHSLNGLYTPAHPAVLRLIKLVVCAANKQGIPVSVCGEIAGDPLFTALLIGLGVHELSVGLCHLAEIKAIIRNTSIVEAVHLADRALQLKSTEEIEALLVESVKIG